MPNATNDHLRDAIEREFTRGASEELERSLLTTLGLGSEGKETTICAEDLTDMLKTMMGEDEESSAVLEELLEVDEASFEDKLFIQLEALISLIVSAPVETLADIRNSRLNPDLVTAPISIEKRKRLWSAIQSLRVIGDYGGIEDEPDAEAAEPVSASRLESEHKDWVEW